MSWDGRVMSWVDCSAERGRLAVWSSGSGAPSQPSPCPKLSSASVASPAGAAVGRADVGPGPRATWPWS